MACFIYVMRGLDTGLLKIGHSWNPSARLRSIAATVEAVELVAAFEAPEATEYELHHRFAAHLADDRGREWFRCEGALAEWLAALPAEHRRTGSRRVRRRAPHFSPENAAAMRRYMWGKKSPSEERALLDYQKTHKHPFVPSAYLDGCVECRVLRHDGGAAPATASEALLRAKRIDADSAYYAAAYYAADAAAADAAAAYAAPRILTLLRRELGPHLLAGLDAVVAARAA